MQFSSLGTYEPLSGVPESEEELGKMVVEGFMKRLASPGGGGGGGGGGGCGVWG